MNTFANKQIIDFFCVVGRDMKALLRDVLVVLLSETTSFELHDHCQFT